VRAAPLARPTWPWLGLLGGVLCAVAIACGGAKSAMAPSATSAMPPPTAGAPGGSRGEIDELSRKIDADLAAMGLPRPAVPMAACVQPPCGAEALSSGARPTHTAEPDCRPGGGEVCRDSCQLSDSICDNSGRICRIAGELGGGDAYANEKCASGKASCDAARTKCCGCQ
jgi:hypothetical protein